jgi:hypothetical protein
VEFEFDDADVGAKENWPAGRTNSRDRLWSRIALRAASAASAIRHSIPMSGTAAAWRCLRTGVPNACYLHFGAVDYEARVWINGKFAGSHRGGQTPFRLDVTDLLGTRAELDRGSRRRPAGRPVHATRQAVLGTEVQTYLVHKDDRHLAPVWLEGAGSSFSGEGEHHTFK